MNKDLMNYKKSSGMKILSLPYLKIVKLINFNLIDESSKTRLLFHDIILKKKNS